ncbi:MAG: T9SS type A sorting domain-containing protein, partial [Ignavibacteria bacterium]|nr:T9SS type A sorting domain-containing protein [Ignavibacteria bacterium]
RYHSEGTWQQLTFTGSGSLSTNSVGGINDAKDVTFTLLLHGQIAYGPDGVAQPLAPLVSAAYGGGSVAVAGELNAKGEIMAEMVIGQTGQRLVRLAPAEPCVSNCIRIASIDMRGKGPSRCDQGQAAAKSRVSVTDEAGNPLSGVTVTAHYMDDYWLDETIVGVTNARGQVSFTHRGPPCVGGIAILVTDATDLGTRTLDRTTGVLADYVLPLPNIGPWDGFSDNRTLLEGVSDKALPIGFALSQNYPNPFNPATTINYQLPVDAFVTLTVTDVLGRTVAVPVSRHEAAGYKSVRFDGSNLTSGIYFYRLQALSTDGRPLDLSSGQAGEFVETRKLMFMK